MLSKQSTITKSKF